MEDAAGQPPATKYRLHCVYCWQTPSIVYNLLPATTAIITYAIGLRRKLSANGQFFLTGAVNLQQATQIISGISFITTQVAYATTN